MSRHVRNKPGEGPRQYKERKLYYGTCSKHGTQYQSFYQRNIKASACGKCRREAARISPGQEVLFGEGSVI